MPHDTSLDWVWAGDQLDQAAAHGMLIITHRVPDAPIGALQDPLNSWWSQP